jgi:hypothetical protein
VLIPGVRQVCYRSRCQWTQCPRKPSNVGDACSPNSCGCPIFSPGGITNLFCNGGRCVQCTPRKRENCKAGEACIFGKCFLPSDHCTTNPCTPCTGKGQGTCGVGEKCIAKVCITVSKDTCKNPPKVYGEACYPECPCPAGLFCNKSTRTCYECGAGKPCAPNQLCYFGKCYSP